MLSVGFSPLRAYVKRDDIFSPEDALLFENAGPYRRRELLASRALIREMAATVGRSKWRGIEKRTGPRGPISIIGARDLSVSLSHAGEWVLAAIADFAIIGVDIEPIGAVFDQPGMLRRMCSVEEYATIQRLPSVVRREHAAQLWTGKEAILKAKGCGLSADPRMVDLGSNYIVRPRFTPKGYASALALLPIDFKRKERGP